MTDMGQHTKDIETSTWRCRTFPARLVVVGLFLLVAQVSLSHAKSQPRVMMIVDASITMEDLMGGELKYKLLRKAFHKVLPKFEGRVESGLVSFGTTSQNSCSDIYSQIEMQPLDAKSFFYRLDRLKPKGRSPISEALAQASVLIGTKPGHIVLLVDGGDNCGKNVCATAAKIASHAPQTRIHVVGLGRTGTLKRLSCVSQATGGSFALSSDLGSLESALERVLRLTQEPIIVAAAPEKPEVKLKKRKKRSGHFSIGMRPPLPKRRPKQRILRRAPEQKTAVLDAPLVTGAIQKQPKTRTAPQQPPQMEEIMVQIEPAPADRAKARRPLQRHSAATPSAQPSGESQPTANQNAAGGAAPVTLLALLTEQGKQIRSGLIWRIYNAAQDQRGHYKLLHKITTPHARLDLPVGSYLVNLAWGRSHLTEKIDVLSASPMSRKLVLNAGGLRLGAQHMQGLPLPSHQVDYQIYSDERNQFGKRQLLLDKALPGRIIRLNAGIYHVKSQYGSANGIVESDITVEAGKLTEAIINHTATKVTFKLVNQPNGEALAGAVWRILSPDGKLVKKTGGALPSLILAAGAYTIHAQYGGRTFARKINIDPGNPIHVEIVIQ